MLVLKDDFRIEKDAVEAAAFRHIVKILQGTGSDHIVGIEKIEVFSHGGIDPQVPSVSLLPVLLQMKYPDPAVPCGEVVQYPGTSVGGSVVDADDLDIRKGLGEHAVKACGKIPFHVVDRYYH